MEPFDGFETGFASAQGARVAWPRLENADVADGDHDNVIRI